MGFRRDVPEILAAMDVSVQPSILREGLPLVLAEAASLSLPLIATDIGGNNEIVADGINGFVVLQMMPRRSQARFCILPKDRMWLQRWAAPQGRYGPKNLPWKL